eukprot:CAMPEP_0183335968 /NCGR_PEP_ID=MMETSP0164_2-20130417/4087_1 /TAXON_ID=221442 /ORGANISM="Coccolithus pelagicus ssp braarudi, Strain PLY182g" /LENGTH=143 /DNA_ID=CAMNT_0025505405 /DNA_START=219 /DNA_END=650 /DNA_ORIENTATION=+
MNVLGHAELGLISGDRDLGILQLTVAGVGMSAVVLADCCPSSAPRCARIAMIAALAAAGAWIGLAVWKSLELRDRWFRLEGWVKAWSIVSLVVMAAAALDHLMLAIAICREQSKYGKSDSRTRGTSDNRPPPVQEHLGPSENL